MEKERLAQLLQEVLQRDFNETVEAFYDEEKEIVDLRVYQMYYKFYFNGDKIIKMWFEESDKFQEWLDLVKENVDMDDSKNYVFKNYSKAVTINWYSSMLIPTILQAGNLEFIIKKIQKSEYKKELKMFVDIVSNYINKYKEMSKKMLPLCNDLQTAFEIQFGK